MFEITIAGINRIRLEFKVFIAGVCIADSDIVLIESDWNLKTFDSLPKLLLHSVLIESDWNLKP